MYIDPSMKGRDLLFNGVSKYLRQHQWFQILVTIEGDVTMDHPLLKKGTNCCLRLAILPSSFFIWLVLESPYTQTRDGTVTFWELPSPNQNQLFKLSSTVYRKVQTPLPIDWWVGGGSISFFYWGSNGNCYSVAVLKNRKMDTQNVMINTTCGQW